MDIEREFGTAAQGKRSIHSYIQDRLLASDAPIILYDHGTGELADFVVFETPAEEVLVSLFHCKASSAPSAGERVEDLYEVCGQAIKSARWIDRRLMIEGLDRRAARGSVFLRGALDACIGLLNGDRRISLQIVLVQPGLSKAQIGARSGPLLGAVDDYVRGGNCHRIRVIGSP